jgi:hypothetical protein
MLRALSVADDWWAMQGYAEPKLPPWLVLGSETLTLQLAAGVVILLALGWRSRHMTALAWVSACAFQFTSRGTGDYHNAVLCTLLFWSLALPTGHALSLDRRSGRWAGWPRSSVTAASVGLITTLAWIYLSTAASKSGAAWWQEGSAVWLALLDRGTPTTPGRWLALQMPGNLWPWITWLSLGIEWLAAPLLLWRRSRPFVVAPLMGFHLLMWPLLALGSFLLVMLVALVGSAAGDILGPTGLVPTRPNLRIRRGTTASADSVSLAGGSDGVGDTHDGRRRTSRCLGGGGGLALRRRSAGRATALSFGYRGCLGDACT